MFKVILTGSWSPGHHAYCQSAGRKEGVKFKWRILCQIHLLPGSSHYHCIYTHYLYFIDLDLPGHLAVPNCVIWSYDLIKQIPSERAQKPVFL